jgi:hypothetical protein
MGKLPKNVTDRVTELENRLSKVDTTLAEINGALHQIADELVRKEVEQDAGGEVPAAPPSNAAAGLGTVGRPFPPESESADVFLCQTAPGLMQKLSEGDMASVMTVTDWLMEETRVRDFFILWFAADEEIRKYLMLTLFFRNLAVAQCRFNIMRSTLSKEAFENVREVYRRTVTAANGSNSQ